MSKTPYDIIAEPIEKWCEENYYTDFIVTILIDGAEITQFLEWDAEDGFIWNSDWWEGEQDVKLEGFIPVSHIRIRGIYGFPPVNVQAVNWIPVTERLPDKRKRVLCRCEANIIDVLRWENNEWYHDPMHVYYPSFVTHWMPIPELPKECET